MLKQSTENIKKTLPFLFFVEYLTGIFFISLMNNFFSRLGMIFALLYVLV